MNFKTVVWKSSDIFVIITLTNNFFFAAKILSLPLLVPIGFRHREAFRRFLWLF